MVQAFEIETCQRSPLSLKDDERLAIIPSPKLPDFLATRIDDAEAMLLAGIRNTIESDLDVEVLPNTIVRSGGIGSGAGVGERFDIRHVPRLGISGCRLGVLGHGDACQGNGGK